MRPLIASFVLFGSLGFAFSSPGQPLTPVVATGSSLIERLRSPDALERGRAAATAGSIGDVSAIPALIGLLGDGAGLAWQTTIHGNPIPGAASLTSVGTEAATALARMGPAAVEPLRSVLATGTGLARANAAIALGNVGDLRALEPLLSLLADEIHSPGSGRVAEALGQLRDRRAVEPLLRRVRMYGPTDAVVEALGKIKDERAIGPLVFSLKDTTNGYKVIEALERITGEQVGRERKERWPKWWEENRSRIEAPAELEKNPTGNESSAATVVLLEQLARAVGDPLRVSAAEELGQRREAAAVEALCGVLGDRDARVGWAAAEALGRIRDARAVEPLIRAAKNPDFFGRGMAIRALGQIGDPRAVEPLLEFLKGDPADIEGSASATALGELGDPRAIPALAQALESRTSSVRISAAMALAAFKDPRAVQPLLRVTTERNHALSSELAAVEALGRIPATEALVSVVAGDDDPSIRERAALLLGGTNDRSAVAQLSRTLTNDKSDDVRRAAARSLGRLKDSRARLPLVSALKSQDIWLRSTAAKSLAQLGDPGATSAVLALLKGTDRELRPTAARALAGSRDPRAVDALLSAMKSDDPELREWAARSLGAIGDRRAVGPLVAVLDDWDGDVWCEAGRALERITGQAFGVDRAQWKTWWVSQPPVPQPSPTRPADPRPPARRKARA